MRIMNKKLGVTVFALVGAILIGGCDSPRTERSNAPADMNGMSHTHGAHSPDSNKHVFLQMMDAMMIEMDSAPLKDSVEYNFLVQMIPHHQGAIQMAEYEITHGSDPEMIQLAKSILAEQQMEIAEMTLLLPQYENAGTASTPQYKIAMDKTMQTMMEKTPASVANDVSVDLAFAIIMLPHHQAAVDMSFALLQFNPDESLTNRAKKIIADQQIEIKQMDEYVHKTNFTF